MKKMSVRPAFTLLEMVLATSIAVLLLAALYVALDLQLRRASDARSVVEQNTLARALVTVITNDVTPGVGTIDPGRYQQPSSSSSGSGSGSGSGTSGTTGTATTPTSSTTSGTTGTTGTTGTSSSSTTSSTSSSTTPILFTIQGQSDSFSIFITRVPPITTDPNNPNPPSASDVRVVSYWVEPGKGLCRQEILQATSDNAQTPQFDPNDPTTNRLAPEVTNMTVQYFDGTNLNDTWDGTQLASDGMTPLGPPLALVVTLEIAPRNSDPNVENTPKVYRHVIAIPTANGSTTSILSASTSSSSSTGSSSSSSSTTP
jgi:hypothetical protein